MNAEGTPTTPAPDPSTAESDTTVLPGPDEQATTALPRPDAQQPAHAEAGYGQAPYGQATVPPAGQATVPPAGQAGYALPPGYQQPGYALPPGYQQPGYPPLGSQPGGYAQPAPNPQRVTRSRSDRVIGGVCGGLARAWNTDPTLLRILTVVLTIVTGGALLLGYLIAWIVMPEDPWPPQGPGGQPAAGYAAGGNPPYGTQGSAQMAAPRERSYLGWLVLSIALVVAGLITLFGVALPDTVATPGIVGGVLLAILGIGLLVGTWYGRARWLAVLAVPVALFTFVAVAAGAFVQSNPNWDRWVVEGSDGRLAIGDQAWRVTSADAAESPLDYRVSAGDAVLDLRPLTAAGAEAGRPGQRVEIDASVGVGQLQVLVPADVRLELEATVDVGDISVPGAPNVGGTQQSLQTTLEATTPRPAYIVSLDAAVGAGSITVEVFA
ncbi:MAG: PspC domain-containing protein [Candidatus Nanopelagicales bacterium]|nr:PspC domain-containing protein [Candidatus Nanopelagicales bacterium]